MCLEEAVVLLLRLPLRVAVALLKQADHLLGFALRTIELVVGELPPLLLRFPLQLFPFPGNDVLVYSRLLWIMNYLRQ
jgi:hypothetical protein